VNLLVKHILAAMMTITAPGMSTYSQTPVKHCDIECQSTPLCENEHDFRCKPPTLNKSLYLQKQEELVAEGIAPAEAVTRALPMAYSRPETYEEGLARYYVIASSIVDVAQKNSYQYCLAENECQKAATTHTGEGSLQACYKGCYESHRWDRTTEQLAWALFTVSTFESGWRADVHSGTGWAGRGDCSWEKDGVKVPAWTEGGKPIISTCNSFGLTQIWFGNPPRVMSSYSRQYTYDQVLGLDAASTRGSLDVAVTVLSRADRLCRGVKHDWAWAMFSLYGSGGGCKVEGAKLRSSRFWKWAYTKNHVDLAPHHEEALLSPHVQSLISYLMQAPAPVLWMPAVDATRREDVNQELASN
jgi:hypothetical protein